MSKGIAAALVKSVAIILLIGGIVWSSRLMSSGSVSQWTFCFLIAASVLVFTVVWLGPALASMEIFNIKLRVREIKASADVVKSLSLLIAQYAEASREGAYVGLTDDATREVQRCIDEIKRIAASQITE